MAAALKIQYMLQCAWPVDKVHPSSRLSMECVNSDFNSLISELKDILSCQGRILKVPGARENVRRECVRKILEAITSFLNSREVLASFPGEFPSGEIRDALSLLFSEVGPGDEQVRTALLEALLTATDPESRQVLLDALPFAMPTEANDLDEVTPEVINALRDILMVDSNALLPVLGCLCVLPLSADGRSEALNVALASLPVVAECDLPVLIRTLLRHVASHNDAFRALTALRTELRLIQDSPSMANGRSEDSVHLVLHILLGAIRDRGNGLILSQAYIDILRSAVDGREPDSFVLLDAVAMLAIYQLGDLRSEISGIMDDMIGADRFPFGCFKNLLSLLKTHHRSGETFLTLYETLVSTLTSISVFLVLAPARLGRVSGAVLSETRDFLIQLHNSVDRFRQEELIRCLLHLSEESSWYTCYPQSRDRGRTPRDFSQAKGMSVTEAEVHQVLQHLALNARGSVVKFKHVLLERLTSSSSRTLANREIDSIQQLCSILSCLIEPAHAASGGGSGIAASEVMILLQKLLFTSSFGRVDRIFQSEESADVGRVVRGLVLATELVKSTSVSRVDKDCIQQWVQRILLPTTRRIVEPEIGRHGLNFLSAWTNDSSSVEQPASEAQTGLFQSIKMILANTGLVQMLESYLQKKQPNDSVLLGYSKTPAFFHANVGADGGPVQTKKIRKLVLCVNYFLRNSDVPHPSRWIDMGRWVFGLIDTYLTLGRRDAVGGGVRANGKKPPKWLPDGWLEACIELPTVKISLWMDRKKSSRFNKWIHDHMNTFDVSGILGPVRNVKGSEIASSIFIGKDLRDAQDDLEVLLRYCLACSVGISLSGAVLRNAFADYLSIGTQSNMSDLLVDRREKEVRKLMQFQLMKIFDLRCKVLLSCQLLKAVIPAFAKAFPGSQQDASDEDSDSDDKDIDQRDEGLAFEPKTSSRILGIIDSAVNQLELAASDQYEKSNLIDLDTAWTCLCDDHDDDLLVQYLETKGVKGDVDGVLVVLAFRREILDYLLTTLQMQEDRTDHREGITHCTRMACRISMLLPDFRRDTTVASFDEANQGESFSLSDAFTTLSVSYYRLLAIILSSSITSTNEIGSNGDVTTECIGICSDAFRSERSALPNDLSALNDRGDSFRFVFECFFDRLRACEDIANALELLDVMSGLTWRNRPAFSDRVLEASWRVLHTVYSSSQTQSMECDPDGLRAPFSFSRVTESMGSAATTTSSSVVERAILATVVKSAERTTKEFTGCYVLRRNLLGIWGLMVHSESRDQRPVRYLSKLIDALDDYLGSFVGLARGRPKRNSAWSVNDQDSSPERSRKRPYLSPIPCLSGSSYVVYYEIVLHMVVSTFALLPHSKGCTRVNDSEMSPFQHLQDTLAIFGRSLEVYTTRFKLFPRRLVGIVLASCRHMLNLCLFHANGCVQWRNSQPVLSVQEKKAGVHDPAAVRYLALLLHCFTASGTGKVLSLCEFVRSQSVPNTREEDSEDDDDSDGIDIQGSDWLFASHHAKFNSIALSAQKAMQAMKDIASAHNLPSPQVDSPPVEHQDDVGGDKTLDEDKGFHELEPVEQDEPFTDLPDNDPSTAKDLKQRKRRRIEPLLVDVDGHTSTDEARQWNRPTIDDGEEREREEDSKHAAIEEDDSQASNDDFAASGGWGEEDSSKDSNSSVGLVLEVTKVDQAP